MRKISKSNYLPSANKPQAKQHVQLLVLGCLILLIGMMTVGNAANLYAAIEDKTQHYVKDVSFQLANDIDAILSNSVKALNLLGDFMAGGQESPDTWTFSSALMERARSFGFSKLVVIFPDGKSRYSGASIEGVAEMEGIQNSFAGENGVSFLAQQGILYSIPVCQNNQIVGVLGGVRDKAGMQKLIHPYVFDGLGLTCILDQSGDVIISPTNREPFLRLDDIFTGETNAEQLSVYQMKKNMEAGKSGVFSFTAVDHTKLILAYDPLNTYGWILLTLVPADLITGQTDLFVVRIFIITALSIVAFIFFLFLVSHALRVYNRQLEQIAFTDPVTEGMTNAAFQLACRNLLRSVPAGTCTVVALNVKNFKLINENFGVKAECDALRHIARTLESELHKDELCARSERDHFFLCLLEANRDAVQARLDHVTESINAFNQTLENPHLLSIIKGAYLVEDPTLEITLIQDRASTACRSSENSNNPACVFYDAVITQRLQWEQELNDAFELSLKSKDFHVYLQPKVSAEDERLIGAEALVRWNHPQLGTISPSDFIPLFEKNGNIVKLDFYMFTEICALLERWMSAGRPLLPISVNLSRQHFRNPDFLRRLALIAGRYHIPCGILELELTENTFFDDQSIAVVKEAIVQMHQLGFSCSLDDFGSGYSALGLLKEFAVDTIKLDRRFFLEIEQEKSQAVIICLMELARKLGLRTVAEGIETPEQLAFLKRINCDMIQGYIYSKPLPISEFERWADAHA